MDKRTSLKRLLSVALVLAMVLSLAVPALAAQADDLNFRKVDNLFEPQLAAQQQVQLEDRMEDRDPEEMVRVSIVLEENSTISAGYAPIGIASNSNAMAYRQTLKAAQAELTEAIENATGSELDVVWNLTLAANLISANIPYGQMDTIRKVPGVAAVFEENFYAVPESVEDSTGINPDMAQSKSQIGSEIAWNAGYTGAGTRIAIIDTGLDIYHEAFNADAFEYSLSQLDGSYDLMTTSDIQAVLSQLNACDNRSYSASQLYYNSKVPFAYNYSDDNRTIDHSPSSSEHGSHVAGIAAANKYVKVGSSYREALSQTEVQGVAPDAQLLIMNVFGNYGCSDADYMAAIEDALILGADAMNLSLGSGSAGFGSAYYYEAVLNELVNSGVVVAMSAGNSGHWYDYQRNGVGNLYVDDVGTHTGGSPGTYTNSLCVASVESADAATAEYYEMSYFSSWGVPGSLTMKPEISAPGGDIYSVAGYVPGYITDHDSYEYMSGTSMASPQVAGMAALVAQYIRESNLDDKTGLDARTLSQSLLMSTAEPMYDYNGRVYPILQQGAGMGHVGNAVSANSFLLMGEDATASWMDGKVKAELGDDPDRTGHYTFSFTIHNITNSAKTFRLSADMFTQRSFTQNHITYMDRDTMALEANVRWNLPGDEEILRDFNGDGTVNEADGQYLLHYIVGNEETLHYEEYADINGDGRITSYDAYLFFTDTVGTLSGNSVEVPANGSVEVKVTVTLTAAQKEQLNDLYTNGAYIQGYVYAVSGNTSHSIPVLGFYGNWTDASMFDKGSAMEFLHGEETRKPYLYHDLSKMNTVQAKTNGGSPYHLGGNPVVRDAQYMPERNAINNHTTSIYGMGWTQIRNAGERYAIVRNTADNTYLTKSCRESEGVVAAYYYVNARAWYEDWQEEAGCWNISGIPENTPLEVGMVAVPEYYTLREEYSFDELGDGAFLTVPVTIDNTAPVMDGYALINNDLTLRIRATDNQYVAAISLLDTTGTVVAQTGSRADARKGQTLEYDLDISAVVGSKFYIQVYDYAGNMSTYELNQQIGSLVDYVTGISITDSVSRLAVDGSYTFIADVQPMNASNRSVTWSSSNRNVATVDASGKVTGVGEGTCTITATSVLDPSFKASCEVAVTTGSICLSGLLVDAENKAVLYDWYPEKSSTWERRIYAPNYWYTSAVQIPGTDLMYACDYNTYSIDGINTATGQLLSSSEGAGLPLSDMAYSVPYSSSGDPRIHGIYETYLFPARQPDSFVFEFFNWENWMSSYTGTSYLVAVASLGAEFYEGENMEHIIAVDDGGYIWDFWVYPTGDGHYTAYWAYTESNLLSAGALQHYRTDVNDNYHSFCSMQIADDGTIYLSSYCFEDIADVRHRYVKLYQMEYTGSAYHATYVGDFGDDVYPVTITAAYSDVQPLSAQENRRSPEPMGTAVSKTLTREDVANMKEAAAGPAAVNVPQPAAPAAQSQEAEPMVVRSLTGETVTPEAVDTQAEENIVIDVYARDAGGNPVARTNGMFLVEYDPAQVEMKLSDTLLYGMKYDVMNIGEAGSAKFAFVSTRGLTATDLMTRLVFKNNATQATTIRITHCDYNDAQSGYVETFTVEPQVQHVRWVQASLSLEGNIGINFYVELSDFLVNNASTVMRFTMNGEAMDVPLADADFRGGQYIFTCPVNAKNMADEVTAQVYADDEAVGKTASMSVRRYATYMVSAGNDTMKKLMKAMLNYGAVAQQTFNHNVGDLANKDLSAEDKILAEVDASPYAHSVAGSERGIRASGITLVLETETAIRVLFTLDGTKSIDQYTFRVDGEVVQPQVWSGNVYFIEIPNIAAQDLDVIHWVQVGGITVRYGGLSYVNQINNLASATQLQKDMAKALFAYWNAAENYFNSL